MAGHTTLLAGKRKRGNPKWGLLPPPLPVVPTEFEMQVQRLGLASEEYLGSIMLRRWCRCNRNRRYVPEWRYGRGEAVTLPGGIQSQSRTPLDFMAVTDHDIWLGEVAICESQESEWTFSNNKGVAKPRSPRARCFEASVLYSISRFERQTDFPRTKPVNPTLTVSANP
jgi:uncharacterized protein DUF3604